MNKLKIYKVGGSIRDKLLGLPSSDNDYVVVGSSIEEMLSLGFKQVGNNFPVFLHPDTHEEYALARSEKKTSIGYKGFKFHFEKTVTLEDDLKRRDLTINAIAQDEKGNLIDPFNGLIDLQNQTIRHVSEAFREDPLRVIRAARFSAQFNFKIAPETFNLMCDIVINKEELQSLPKERIMLELIKALKSPNVIHFFNILNTCGALSQILPEFKILFTNNNLAQILNNALNIPNISINTKLILMYYIINSTSSLNESLSVINNTLLPNEVKNLVIILLKTYPKLIKLIKIKPQDINPQELYKIITILDPTRQKMRFTQFLELLKIILSTDKKNMEVNKIIIIILDIIKLFESINYIELFKNNTCNNQGKIVYNKKLEIINKYLSHTKE